jgi:hypothetical protein
MRPAPAMPLINDIVNTLLFSKDPPIYKDPPIN